MRRLGFLLLIAFLITGCGDEGPPVTSDGDVPITQRAIAAMALEHAPEDTSSREATYTDRSDPKGALGADLRYPAGAGDDGDLLRVFLQPGAGPEDLCADRGDSCEGRDVDGGRLTLAWTLEEPEEDPGYVSVVLQREDETVSVSWFGDTITGDPREQDLEIPIETLEAIAQDPRISLTTSQAVVDAGADLDDWDGGEPDPHAYDRVPSTDQAVAWSYWLHFGGYSYYHRLRPSPLKAELGDGAIGGRFDLEGTGRNYPAMTIDVLAAPQLPSWMNDDVCATPRFAGRCIEADGRRGPRYLAWVPGPKGTGEVWAVGVREDELVAVRFADVAVPEDRGGVEMLSQWSLLRGYLDDRRLGLETDKEVLDSEF